MRYRLNYETYRNEISLTFDQIWILQCEQHPRTRTEKKTIGNYATVEKYGDLKEEFWVLSERAVRDRCACSQLRKRSQLVHVICGILRSEYLYRAELIDFM
jgi:hypothetical protein